MSAPQHTQDTILVEHTQRIMATPMGVHLAVPRGDEAQAREAIERVVAWLVEVERRLTRFDAASELSHLNAASGRWRAVSPVLFEAVEQSVAAAHATDGLFDPGLLPRLEALGYDRDFAQIARREAGAEWRVDADAAGPGAWRGIELDRWRRRVRLPLGVRLDLGGIVKGWAADVALGRFLGSFDNVLVDAGGDIRARGGMRPGAGWAIGIGEPSNAPPTDIAAHADTHTDSGADGGTSRVVLTLGRGGLATSGATHRWWYRAGVRQHHLLDPRTGQPARVWIDAADDGTDLPLVATATALAPTTAQAEVAAKVALLRGYPQALAPVEQAWKAWRARDADGGEDDDHMNGTGWTYSDAGVALILVLGTGEVVCSTNLREYLATSGGGGNIWLD